MAYRVQGDLQVQRNIAALSGTITSNITINGPVANAKNAATKAYVDAVSGVLASTSTFQGLYNNTGNNSAFTLGAGGSFTINDQDNVLLALNDGGSVSLIPGVPNGVVNIGSPTVSGNLVVHGNLDILGNTTTINSTVTTTQTRILILNSGEVGVGITAGSGGIQVQRGSLTNAQLLYVEGIGWQAGVAGNLFTISDNASLINSGTVLTGLINTEITNRTAGDNLLTQEVLAVSGNVNTTNTNLVNSGTVLTGLINTEITNRTNADNFLQFEINTLSGSIIASDVAILELEIETLSGNLITSGTILTGLINTEITNRSAADNLLTFEVLAVSGNVNTTNTNLVNSGTLLTGLINTEITNRSAADTLLQAEINTLSGNLIISGSLLQPISANLSNLAALASTGFVVQTGSNTFADRTLTTNSGIIFTNAAGVAGNPTISVDAANISINSFYGPLSVTNGGTGLNASSASNGQLLIGNGTGFSLATLTQGSGIIITNTAGGIQLSVDFSATVTAGSGLVQTANQIDVVSSNGGIVVTQDAIALTLDSSTLAITGNGIKVNAGGITGTELNSSVAGGGLTGGGGSALAVNPDGKTIQIVAGQVAIKRYTYNINTSDWSASDGTYSTYVIAATTHGYSTVPTVKLYAAYSGVVALTTHTGVDTYVEYQVDAVKMDAATGDITLVVVNDGVTDARFASKIIIG